MYKIVKLIQSKNDTYTYYSIITNNKVILFFSLSIYNKEIYIINLKETKRYNINTISKTIDINNSDGVINNITPYEEIAKNKYNDILFPKVVEELNLRILTNLL